MNDNIVDWSQDKMIEVILNQEDDFLKIKETLTRIGIASHRTKTLWQSCHVLHKQGKYYIVHFKEMFALDGKKADLSVEDVERRNSIIRLLVEWDLCKLADETSLDDFPERANVKILRHSEKDEWTLQPKYNIGVKH